MSEAVQVSDETKNQLLTFHLSDQLFGLPVLEVNDVLGPQIITQAPLSPPSVSGVMNLRGRIVTSIDVRRCLKQTEREEVLRHMNIVIEHLEELYSLEVDSVGDVLTLSQDTYEDTPPTLSPDWQEVSSGVHKLKSDILVILNVEHLLKKAGAKSALSGGRL